MSSQFREDILDLIPVSPLVRNPVLSSLVTHLPNPLFLHLPLSLKKRDKRDEVGKLFLY